MSQSSINRRLENYERRISVSQIDWFAIFRIRTNYEQKRNSGKKTVRGCRKERDCIVYPAEGFAFDQQLCLLRNFPHDQCNFYHRMNMQNVRSNSSMARWPAEGELQF